MQRERLSEREESSQRYRERERERLSEREESSQRYRERERETE